CQKGSLLLAAGTRGGDGDCTIGPVSGSMSSSKKSTKLLTQVFSTVSKPAAAGRGWTGTSSNRRTGKSQRDLSEGVIQSNSRPRIVTAESSSAGARSFAG